MTRYLYHETSFDYGDRVVVTDEVSHAGVALKWAGCEGTVTEIREYASGNMYKVEIDDHSDILIFRADELIKLVTPMSRKNHRKNSNQKQKRPDTRKPHLGSPPFPEGAEVLNGMIRVAKNIWVAEDQIEDYFLRLHNGNLPDDIAHEVKAIKAHTAQAPRQNQKNYKSYKNGTKSHNTGGWGKVKADKVFACAEEVFGTKSRYITAETIGLKEDSEAASTSK